MIKLKQEQWSRVAGDYVALKEDKEFAISVEQKDSVREETNAVSGTTVMSVQNPHQKPLHPLNHQHEEVEVRRGKEARGRSQTGRIIRQPCRYYLKGTCARSLCEYWHPPERQFYKTESGCEAGDKCLFPQYKIEEQPSEKPKKSCNPQNGKSDDKGAVAIVRTVPQLGCVSQDSAIRTSEKREVSGKPEAQQCWDQFDEYDSQGLHCVKETSQQIKVRRLVKYNSKFLISEVRTL